MFPLLAYHIDLKHFLDGCKETVTKFGGNIFIRPHPRNVFSSMFEAARVLGTMVRANCSSIICHSSVVLGSFNHFRGIAELADAASTRRRWDGGTKEVGGQAGR